MRLFVLLAFVRDGPHMNAHAEAMGVLQSWALVIALVAVCWGSVQLYIWFNIKLKTHVLLREIDRAFGVGRDTHRLGRRR